MLDLSKVIKVDPAKENITAEVDFFCTVIKSVDDEPISYNSND